MFHLTRVFCHVYLFWLKYHTYILIIVYFMKHAYQIVSSNLTHIKLFLQSWSEAI